MRYRHMIKGGEIRTKLVVPGEGRRVAGKKNDFVVRGLSVLGECEPTYFDEENTNTEDSVNRKTRRGKPKE